MVTVRESEIDGVPCFWVESGRPTLAASLLFRQGQADEPFHETGWLHLLEHTVLHGTGGGSLHVNGSVSLLVTSFDAHGPADAVADHLSRLTSWLANPELGRIERERGVLRAESAMRGGPMTNSLQCRYGAQGPGVASYAEPGLARATPAALWDRCRRVFNRGNAVLVLDGPPSRRLRLGLPEGSFLPTAPAVAAELRFPSAYREEAGLVLSGVVERSAEAGIAASLLEKALRLEIRERAGAAYAPWSTYEAVDTDTAVIVAGSDLQPDILPTILEKSLLVLERLRTGVPHGWIDEQVELRLQALRDPYNAMAIAMRAGHSVLSEKLPPTYDELIAETEQTDSEKVKRAFEQLRSSLLIGAPGRTKLPTRIPRAEYPRTRSWQETRGHRHRNWPLNRTRAAIGPSGVELVEGSDALQVRAVEVAGLMKWQDGTRHVVGRDGWGLTMVPAQWHRGPNLVRSLDALVTPDLQLEMEGTGPVEFKRLTWRRRWVRPLRRSLASAPGLALVAVVLAVIGVLLVDRSVAVATPFVVVAIVFLLRVPRAFFRGRRRLW